MPTNSVLARLAVVIAGNTAQFNKAMNEADKKLGVFNKTLTGLSKNITGLFGTYYIYKGLEYGVSTLAKFERQMDTVAAITGATGDEFKSLERNALALGAATEYTASQVASLQVEYGRLGFKTQEILNSTKATINLATATGSDLARSSEIAGSTLRAFQLDAKQMTRVTDVMASSFNKSALSLDNFAESIKYVSPVAKAVDVSLEETVGLLGVLADAGIKGSQAGTSLRRIFTQLTADGRPLQERLDELAKKGITLADANDEVGLYAQTALLVIASQKQRVDELTKSLKNAAGETQRVADIMRDNLIGDVDKLTSSWEGAILRGNAFIAVLRGITQFFTIESPLQKTLENLGTALNASDLYNISRGIEILKGFADLDRIDVSDTEINNLTTGMKDSARVAKELKRIITEINQEREKQITNNKATADIDPLTGLPLDEITGVISRNEELAKQEQERLRRQQMYIDSLRKMHQELTLINADLKLQEEAFRAIQKVQADSGISEGVARLFPAGGTFGGGDMQAGIAGAIAGAGGISMNLFEVFGFPEPEEVDEEIQKYADVVIENFKKLQKQTHDELVRTAQSYAKFSDIVGDSLVKSIESGDSFVESLVGQTDRIVGELYRQAIAYILTNSAKFPNPIAAIALATGAAVAMRALFASVRKGSESGGVTSANIPRERFLEVKRDSEPMTVEVSGKLTSDFGMQAEIRRSKYKSDRVGG